MTDLSPGMVKVATRNGRNLGLDIDGRVADAEGIPYEDDTFDLVVGHAVLHHIPDVELSLREVIRVLKPGGRFVFAGEPTTVGKHLRPLAVDADLAGGHQRHQAARLGNWLAPAGRTRRVLAGRGAGGHRRPAHLRPGRPGRLARNAGAVEVSTATTEFTAAMLGWPLRTFEASVPPAGSAGAGRSSRSAAGSR